MTKRLESLDALRGLDMLMIMGMGKVVVSFCVLCGWGADCALARQFAHVDWDGLRFEDTIFPLFLFLAGVSWPLSYAKQRACAGCGDCIDGIRGDGGAMRSWRRHAVSSRRHLALCTFGQF